MKEHPGNSEVTMDTIIKKYFVQNNCGILIQLMRYSITGVLSALVDISLFSLMANILHVNHIAANTLAFAAGLYVNYFVASKWVFNSNGKQESKKSGFILYAVIGILGLILSNLLLFVFIDLRAMYEAVYLVLSTAGDGAVKLMSKITAVLLVFIWNFTMRRKLFSISERSKI